ncbi:MAG: prepilin-type N-terminal cleavage/methylation domain-containing protein [Thermovirgaceae bacterium]|nr:prepilin-type N-terminal cleavage/methylation domain-containing protein [Thermovirgaceae bacterium]
MAMKEPAEPISARKRGTRFGFPLFWAFSGRKGHSLAEVLAVFAILAILSAMAYPAVGGLLSSRAGTQEAARAEARNVARWIERTLQKACLHHRALNFKYLVGYQEKVMILWFNPAGYETYGTNGRCLVRFMSTSTQDRCYSPMWHTMTPAFTLSFHVPGKLKQKVAEIAVSGYCSVSLTEFFP